MVIVVLLCRYIRKVNQICIKLFHINVISHVMVYFYGLFMSLACWRCLLLSLVQLVPFCPYAACLL